MEDLWKAVGVLEVMKEQQQQQLEQKNMRRKKRKKKTSTNHEQKMTSDRAASAAGLISRSSPWFKMYDVFRCKQLNIHLSAVRPRYTRQPDHQSGEEEQKIDHRVRVDDPKQQDRHSNDQLQQQQQQQMSRKSVELQRRMETVRRLQSSDLEQQAIAAGEIRAATRRDGEARTTLALMGAIPPLVTMLDSPNSSSASPALVALLNLAVRNDQNKAAIVAAGAVPKIVKLIHDPKLQLIESSVAALLSLSALDSNKTAIAQSQGAAAALISAISSPSSSDQGRRDAMGALYNLSLCAANAAVLCNAAAVPALLSAVYDPALCSRAVAIGANLVSTLAGRRAISRVENSALVFVDVLNWGRCGCPPGASSSSQVERAVYVVMILAECSAAQRRAMMRAGCSSVLLELVLVGSPTAQDRASRALQFLDDGFSDSSTNSYCLLLENEEDREDDIDEQQTRELLEQELYSAERRAVNKLVQQSLRLNMQRITKRACIPFVPAH